MLSPRARRPPRPRGLPGDPPRRCDCNQTCPDSPSPDRRFILLGDGGYNCHALARFCRRHRRHRRHVTRVALFYPDANLYTPPPPRRPGQKGRPRVRGDERPAPADVVAAVTAAGGRKRSVVGWYGGGRRRVEFVTGTGHGYKGGGGLAAVRWVFVHDRDGTHEDRSFYCTDPALSPSRIITLYAGRWSIEVTFREARAHLGLHTTRCRAKPSVLREVPCLLGLFRLVTLIDRDRNRGQHPAPRSDPWHAKADVTFADAIAAVRRVLWQDTVLERAAPHGEFQKLPPDLRDLLLDRLSLAA